jgi:DNA-binding NarL/FixJ family response regulator
MITEGNRTLQQTGTIQVFIAEDKDVIRAGLRQLVSSIKDCSVVGDASDGETAWKHILELKPSVVLMKDALPGLDGIALCQRIKREMPRVGVVMMLSSPNDFWPALTSKADAYFFREVPANILEPAIRTVAEGGAFLGNYVADYLLRGDGYNTLKLVAGRRMEGSDLGALSKREHEVLGLLAEGKSNEQIANVLGLSIQTVKVHVKHILKKLKVSDRTQAVIKALRA